MDLVTSLYQKLDKFPQVGFDHPFQYSLAIIALCTAGKDVGQKKYLNYIIHNIPNQLLDGTFGENEVTAALSYQASKVDLIYDLI